MAFLAQDDKQLQDQTQQQGGQTGASGGGGFVGSGSGATSTAPNTAGVGSGGTGGWTNIQSYLAANQNSNTGQYLQNQAQKTYDSENQNFQNQSNQSKQQAQDQANSENVGQDAATKMINNASQYYQYNNQPQSNNGATGTVPGQTVTTGNGQSDQYNQALKPIQQVLSAQYQGPSSFSYGMGSDAQRYANGLSNDQGFHGLMDNVYNQAAGGQMNSGALALQQQIDQDNPNLNQTRQTLNNQFSGLQSQEQQGTQATDAAVKAAQSQFGQNQQNFKSTLEGMGTQDKSAIDQAVQGFNANTQGGPSLNDIDFSSLKSPYVQDSDPFNKFLQAQAQAAMGGTVDQGAVSQGISPLITNGAFDPGELADIKSAITGTAKYNPGNANEMNVGGVDQQRNAYNSIQDALGLGGNIGYDPTAAKNGQYSVNWNDYMKYLSQLPMRPGSVIG